MPSRPAGRATKAGPGKSRRGWWAAAGLGVLVAVILVVQLGGGESSSDGPASEGASAGVVGGDFHSLVADPTTPGRLFVGGHTAVSVSTDGGRTWSAVASLAGADAMGWAITADAVYVSGHPGINRSNGGIGSFSRANAGLPDTDVHALGAGAGVMYAAGPSNGVLASADGGRTWERRSTSAGPAFFGRILVDEANEENLVAADARSGAMASSDGGRTWRSLGGPPGAAWVSRGPAGLVVSGPKGAARSVDGGQTWAELVLPQGASLVEADPTDPDTLYAGIHDGAGVRVLVSRDGGGQWEQP